MTFIQRCDIGGMITKNWLFFDCFCKNGWIFEHQRERRCEFRSKGFQFLMMNFHSGMPLGRHRFEYQKFFQGNLKLG